MRKVLSLIAPLALLGAAFSVAPAHAATTTTYNINTLAGKVASINGTAGLQIRMSAFLEEEADSAETSAVAPFGNPITPTFVLSSVLDGTSVQAPDVTVNGDTAGAPQNETAIAVDPNNPNRVVGGANDYATRTWACTIGSTPCSALGDGYSGTYFSNDGGASWCCTSSDVTHQGTLIPGVDHLSGGQYDAGGDPSVAFDSRGNVYYAGLGFDRTAAPNTVAVNKGTFDNSGALHWSAPTFINQTTAPSTLNDKEWIAADSNASSPFRDRVYVTWTRFIFNAHDGRYVQSPIDFVYSKDGGKTFSSPQLISGNVLYGQGSRPVVGPDGTLYVFWSGSTRLAALDSIYMVKSTDGGATWSQPVAVAPLAVSIPLANTAFRVNSFPAAAVGPDGKLYVTWSSEIPNIPGTYNGTTSCAYYIVGTASVRANCHNATAYSVSSNGGASWSTPQILFSGTRTAEGYPVMQPSGATLNAPSPLGPAESIFPSIAVSPDGTHVYLGAYVGNTVSPWQTCAHPATPTSVGRINCLSLGNYVNNTRLDYEVADLSTDTTNVVSTHPINTRVQFGGGFFGDYTDLAAGSDNTFHAFWTDSNNRQSVTWFYGFNFVPTTINQEDVVTASGSF